MIHCALIVASLNSLADSLPPELIAALVKHNVWARAQGLAYARQKRDLGSRATALVYLAPHLPEADQCLVLQEAMATARALRDGQQRAWTLYRLASHLPGPLKARVLQEALAEPRKTRALWEVVGEPRIEDEQRRALELFELTYQLPGPERDNALQNELTKVKRIENKRDRAKALESLAPYLPESLLREALAMVQTIDQDYRDEALVSLAPRLAELGCPKEALVVARGIESERGRAKALEGMAPYLPEPLLREALAIVQAIHGQDYRDDALVSLAPRLADLGRPEEALVVARGIRNEKRQAKALASLASYLSKPEQGLVLQEALAAVGVIRDQDDCAETLAGLAPYLSELLLREALAAAHSIRDNRARAMALASLVLYLPEPLVERTLQEALAATRMIHGLDDQVEVLTTLVTNPSEPDYTRLLDEISQKALNISKTYLSGLYALCKLIPCFPVDSQQKIAEMAWHNLHGLEITFADFVEAQTRLAIYLPLEILHKLVNDAILTLPIPGVVRYCMIPMIMSAATRLPGAEQGLVLQRVLVAVRDTQNKDDRAVALARLVPYLPDPLHGEAVWEALMAVRTIEREENRAEALTRLAPYLPDSLRGEAMQEALAAAQEIEREENRAEALTRLAPYLPDPLLGEALQEALAAAREIGYEWVQVDALTGLAPHLPKPLLGEALAVARGIGNGKHRARALIGLAPHLAALDCARLYPIWRETLPVLAARTRKDLLSDLHALSPVIAALGGPEAIVETFHAIQDVGRW